VGWVGMGWEGDKLYTETHDTSEGPREGEGGRQNPVDGKAARTASCVCVWVLVCWLPKDPEPRQDPNQFPCYGIVDQHRPWQPDLVACAGQYCTVRTLQPVVNQHG
jgi:hypothetical protein